jgi:hypothetical protein
VSIDPYDDCSDYGEFRRQTQPPDRGSSRNWPAYLLDGYRPRGEWCSEPPTDRQVEALERRGYTAPPGLTRGEASHALDRPTPKQRAALRRCRRWRESMTFAEAREALDELFGGRGR